MAKKDFKGGLSSLLGENKSTKVNTPKEDEQKEIVSSKRNRGRPKTVYKEITKSSQEGTKEGETRATFIVKESKLEKLKSLAYWERMQIKEVINDVIEQYIENYENSNGEIKAIPKKK